MSGPESSPYVLLSYASAERPRALTIADALEQAGVRVWLDRRSIPGGTNWDAEIVRAISGCGALLLLVSDASVRSPNVQQELRLAWEDQRPILPLLLERVPYPDDVRYLLAGRQWIDFLDAAPEASLPRLLEGLLRVGVHPAPTPPTNLPTTLTSFVGRERELSEAARLLASARLLTLTGVGGTGKTRLALALAQRARYRYPDGVFFIDLAPLTDATLVPSAIARTLGVRETPDQPLRDALRTHLHGKRTLLLLDNFEQVVEAAPLVGELLGACDGLAVVVTSRTALRASGEQEYPVPPLPVPDAPAAAPLAALAANAAVALFVARARAARQAFALTEENAAAVAEICARLDGLPLAIELAAARIRLLSPQAIRDRLGERLTLLTGGARDAPERQQTLRGAIRWSYDLLDEQGRALFRRVAVFAGGWTLAAADAVCHTGTGAEPGGSSLDGLAALAEQSLILQSEEADGEPRFRMLETIREYALEQLEASGGADAARGAHARYFHAFVEHAATVLAGPEQAVWLARLEADHDNLRATLQWSLGGGADIDTGLAVVSRLGPFWEVRGHLVEGRRWLERALSAADAAPEPLRLRALSAAGGLARAQGDMSRAATCWEEALTIARRLGDDARIAGQLLNLGIVANAERDHEHASALLEESLALARKHERRSLMARALNHLGNAARAQGDRDRAAALYAESLALNRELGDRRETAWLLANLARIAAEEGNVPRASSLLEESAAVFRELGDRRALSQTLIAAGEVARQRQEYDRAAAMYDEARSIGEDLDLPTIVSAALHNLGHAALWEGEVVRGEALLRDGLERLVAEHPPALHAIANFLTGLGCTAAAARQDARAAALLGAADHQFAASGAHRDPPDRSAYERYSVQARSALGEVQYTAAYEEGRALSLDAAVALALAQTEQPVAPPGGAAPGRSAGRC